MDFNYSKQQQQLREDARSFCEKYCSEEQAAALDREPRFPTELHRGLAEAGLMGHGFPSSYGGSDGGTTDIAVLYEVIGAHSDAAVNLLFVNYICGSLIVFAGTDAQKEEFVNGIAAGELRFAFALSEPEAGSDAGSIQTTAVRDGNEYVINGVKLYTTGARDADYILTAVRTDPDRKASAAISLLIVPTGTEGVHIEAMDKIAGNAVTSCRVEYTDVRLPLERLLGDENQAWPILMIGGGLERLVVGASAVGAAQSILDEALAFVKQREQFGQPIGGFQAVQHQLADIATEIDAARLLVYRAAWRIDQGEQPMQEVSMAKLYASERLSEIAMRGMRLLGGRAYLRETPMPRRLREAMLSLYAGGTVEIQRNLIARGLGL